MNQKSVFAIAEQFGLTIEQERPSEHEAELKVFKGANQVFTGTEEAVRGFLSSYVDERPGLFEGSMYGYME